MYDSQPQNWIFLLDISKFFMVEAHATLDTSASVSLRTSEVRMISAAAIILALLNRAWDALGGTLQYAEEVAEKAWEMEKYLRDSKAEVFDKRDKNSVPKEPSNVEGSDNTRMRRLSTIERLLKRRPETSTNSSTPIQTPESDKNKKILTGLAFSSLTSDEKSPWSLYLERRRARGRPSVATSPGTNQGPNHTGPSQWEYTKRTDRVRLLSTEEQKLVHQLMKPGLTKKEERRLFGELRRLTGPQQDRVLECVRVLKSESKGDGEAIHAPALGLA